MSHSSVPVALVFTTTRYVVSVPALFHTNCGVMLDGVPVVLLAFGLTVTGALARVGVNVSPALQLLLLDFTYQ